MRLFKGYVRRFGTVYAELYTPKMRTITGEYELVKGPGEFAIQYWNITACVQSAEREVQHTDGNVITFKDIVLSWPSDAAGYSLPSFTFKSLAEQ